MRLLGSSAIFMTNDLSILISLMGRVVTWLRLVYPAPKSSMESRAVGSSDADGVERPAVAQGDLAGLVDPVVARAE